MSRRAKIVITIIVVLLLALLAAFFLIPSPPAEPVINEAPVDTNQPVNGTLPGGGGQNFNLNVSQPPVNVPVTLPPVLDDRLSLRNTAKSFAELFGSFSSEGNYQNIVDAEYYMSDSVIAWAEQYVAEQRAKPRSGEFFGTTTRVIFEPDVREFDLEGGTAQVVVNTRRIETGATIGSQNVYYQDITLDFIRAGNEWKVNRFTWGPK